MAVEGLMAHGPPAQPKWLFFLTIGIIVLSFGAFIAACVNVSAYDSWGWSASSGPGGFMIFDVSLLPVPMAPALNRGPTRDHSNDDSDSS
jgi:hypothetical protein